MEPPDAGNLPPPASPFQDCACDTATLQMVETVRCVGRRQVRLNVEEVRRDDLRLDQLQAKATLPSPVPDHSCCDSHAERQ